VTSVLWAIAVGLLTACTTQVEPLAPEPVVPHVGDEDRGGGEWSASTSLEVRVRRLYDACRARRAALEDEVESGYGGDAAVTTIAVGTAIAASGAADSSGLAARAAVDEGGPAGVDVQNRHLPQEPARPSRGRRRRAEADAEIARINEALADLESWVGAHPDPRAWSDDDRDTFETHRETLDSLCN
jgi:hypothetical protein